MGRIRVAALAVALIGAPIALATPEPAAAIDPLPFGFNQGSLAGPGYTADSTIDAINDLNPGSIVRINVDWFQMQKGKTIFNADCDQNSSPLLCTQPGTITWGPFDATIKAIGEAGMRVLLVPMAAPPWARESTDVITPHPGPDGVNQVNAPPGTSPGNLTKWRNFIVAVLARAQGAVTSGPNAHPAYPDIVAGVEVWNEQNGRQFWTVGLTAPHGAHYTTILCNAYAAVNAHSPDVPVIFGGLHPTPRAETMNEPTNKTYFLDFLEQAYDVGAKNCMDRLGIHAYPTEAPGMAGFLNSVDLVRDTAAANGDAGRTLSITEVGLTGWSFTEEDLAEFTLESYQAADEMEDVDMYLQHSLFPTGHGPNSYLCNGPGDPGAAAHVMKAYLRGTSEPAYCAEAP